MASRTSKKLTSLPSENLTRTTKQDKTSSLQQLSLYLKTLIFISVHLISLIQDQFPFWKPGWIMQFTATLTSSPRPYILFCWSDQFALFSSFYLFYLYQVKHPLVFIRLAHLINMYQLLPFKINWKEKKIFFFAIIWFSSKLRDPSLFPN